MKNSNKIPFIQASSTLSYQKSFQNDNWYSELEPITDESQFVLPDYKAYIPAASLRRLSPALRNGMVAALDCQQQIGDKSFDSIIVGTALGCLMDTEKFLVTTHTVTGDFLPPTSFIQSTHNTIAGQISLGLNNHSYNMTHTQNSLSFEIALLDALLSFNEGKQHILVGAAEEEIGFLNSLQPTVIQTNERLTSGAVFFVLGNESASQIAVNDVQTWFNCETPELELENYLTSIGKSIRDFDLVLHSGMESLIQLPTAVNYVNYTGFFYTNSAMAMAMGESFLKQQSDKADVLIVNQLVENQLGVIILSKS